MGVTPPRTRMSSVAASPSPSSSGLVSARKRILSMACGATRGRKGAGDALKKKGQVVQGHEGPSAPLGRARVGGRRRKAFHTQACSQALRRNVVKEGHEAA